MNAPDPSSFSLDPTNEDDAALISYFVSELPKRIQTLREATDARDLENIQRIAHQLKGAAPSFGFPAIGSAARDLENATHAATVGSIDLLSTEINALINLCLSYTKES